MFKALARIFSAPYSYVAGPDNLGVGIENLALVQSAVTMESDFYSPRYNIRRSFDLRPGGYADTDPSYPFTDLRSDGVYLSGALDLQSLINLSDYSG